MSLPSNLPYSGEFFTSIQASARDSAAAIVPWLLGCVPAQSVVDLGCGNGAWLEAFLRAGVADIRGIDGAYVDRAQLLIPANFFESGDLTRPLAIKRRYDLALSLEVGEHLPAASAADLVAALVALSDIVLFSAAVPGQGGTHHVNEQWPEYWAKMFSQHGYQSIDCIRPRFWRNESVAWWYAQNAVIYISRERSRAFPRLMEQPTVPGVPLPLVHPRLLRHHEYLRSLVVDEFDTPGIAWCCRAFVSTLNRGIRRRVKGSLGPKKRLA